MSAQAHDGAQIDRSEQSLGALVRGWRERALLTQEELAARSGLNVRTIRRLETGELRRPRHASVDALVHALGLTPAERVLLTQATVGMSVRAARLVPHQLPADVAAFVGRTQELALLEDAGEATAMITAIDGMAGVGKTALAIRAAHQLAPRFPDGDLFINLHGHTEGMTPADPAETLARILDVLGVPGEAIPTHLEDRAALYRSTLAGRRMLVVFDNVADEGQVRPLLPGTAGCLVLITSRRRLIGLDNVRTLSIDVLPQADAIALFTNTAGHHRTSHTPDGVLTRLVHQCGLLPLAIRLAAARLKAHPAWAPTHLLDRLTQHQHRLSELHAGHDSITAALDLSYRDLTAAQQHAYRLLGLHPGTDITAQAAGALLDTSAAHAATLLDHLLESHLLQEPAPNRFHLHDLIRAHAAHLATVHESAATRRAAITRLLDHYTHAASTAVNLLYPYEADTRPLPPATTDADLGISDTTTATTWLDTELPNLLPLTQHAAQHGYRQHIHHLSATLARCLHTRGRYTEAETILVRALSAARDTTADHTAEMDALLGLAEIHRSKSRYDTAVSHAERALAIAREIRHRSGELRALNTLGIVHLGRDQLDQALDHFVQALDLARAIGHRTGELDALAGASNVLRFKGRYEESASYLTLALTIAQAIGHHTSELRASLGLGYVHLALGDQKTAADFLVRVLTLARSTGHRIGELSSLNALGLLHHMEGRHEQARECYQQVLRLSRKIGNRNFQFEAIHGIGGVEHDEGRYAEALDSHRQALDLATDLDQPSDQARAHNGLAHAYAALGRPRQAHHHWTKALTILTSLGIERIGELGIDVETIRAHLSAVAAESTTTAPGTP
ncbi:MAG TPA: tetratricopeptide repeat protein [Nonomuraea sp.]|nr:tetratricopeptide repeat protein [Nonomuraea sp.]